MVRVLAGGPSTAFPLQERGSRGIPMEIMCKWRVFMGLSSSISAPDSFLVKDRRLKPLRVAQDSLTAPTSPSEEELRLWLWATGGGASPFSAVDMLPAKGRVPERRKYLRSNPRCCWWAGIYADGTAVANGNETKSWWSRGHKMQPVGSGIVLLLNTTTAHPTETLPKLPPLGGR